MKIMRSLLIIFSFLTLVSCNYHYEKFPQSNTTPLPNRDWKYADVKRFVIDPYCIRCHLPPDPKGEMDLSSYKSIEDMGLIDTDHPEESTLYTIMKKNKMPPKALPKVTPELQQHILNWIKQGAHE